MIQAILIMLVAMTFVPAGDAASKALTTGLGVAPVFVVWSRFVIGALVVAPFTWRAGLAVAGDWRVWFRALLILMGISCITQAIKTAPLADVFGAFFIGPMISFALSVWLLKERVIAAQVALLGLGFVGVLLITRPGFDVSPGLGWAVLAGCCYGSFLTASRWLAGQVPLGGLMFTQLVGPALMSTPFVIGYIPQMTAEIAGLAAASALCSMAGNLLLLFVYKRHDASKMAPFVYFQLISAVGFGWLFFGDFPVPLTLAGMGCIIVAGCAVAVLQSRRPIPAGA